MAKRNQGFLEGNDKDWANPRIRDPRPSQNGHNDADVQGALGVVASGREARVAIRRATKIVGVEADQPLKLRELVRICSALAAEDGVIQQLAEEIAGDTLRG